MTEAQAKRKANGKPKGGGRGNGKARSGKAGVAHATDADDAASDAGMGSDVESAVDESDAEASGE